MMRFLIDENLPFAVGDLFGNAGHEVMNAADEGLSGYSDESVTETCKSTHSCLVTLDTDFAKIGAYRPEDYSGIIVIRLGNQGLRSVMQIVPRLLLALESNAVKGRLWVVERYGIRVRGGKAA